MLTVVYLIWTPAGREHVDRFLASYHKHRAGIPHRLLLAVKGDAEVDGYETLRLSPSGFDISAYFAVAREVRTDYLCFLNTYSEILAPDWLAKMYEHIQKREAGAVGATGSLESYYTQVKAATYPHRFRPRARMLRLEALYKFPPFPNAHLRTNAFMLRRETMLKLKYPQENSKADPLRFESGRNSMTRQLRRMKLETFVVGRDGRAYPPEHWRESWTFRSGGQRNLLIGDNRTKQYADASCEDKRILAQAAWGLA